MSLPLNIIQPWLCFLPKHIHCCSVVVWKHNFRRRQIWFETHHHVCRHSSVSKWNQRIRALLFQSDTKWPGIVFSVLVISRKQFGWSPGCIPAGCSWVGSLLGCLHTGLVRMPPAERRRLVQVSPEEEEPAWREQWFLSPWRRTRGFPPTGPG